MQELLPYNKRAQIISTAIELWLKSKKDASSSKRTEEIYRGYIFTFREVLQNTGYDLDGLPVDRDITNEDLDIRLGMLSLAAQGWASTSKQDDGVEGTTYNQRISILSSFYRFARKRQLLRMDNPIDLLDRRKVQEYAHAQPLSREEVSYALKTIDRTVIAGKRDYALLLILLSTGRRASEMVGLQWRDIRIADNTITLNFHCKGNIEMYDALEPRVSKALLDYLHSLFMHDLASLQPDQHIWLSFSMKNFKQPLTQRGLADIMQNRLKTMKIHTTRHTFAYNMAASGASLVDIQFRLGHANVATTGRYIQRLSSAENKHVSTLLDFLGVENED